MNQLAPSVNLCTQKISPLLPGERPDSARFRKAVENTRDPHRLAVFIEQRIISAQIYTAVLVHDLQHLRLGLQDSLLRPQIFDMGHAYIGNYAQLGSGNSREIPDLSEVIHSHLQNCRLNIFLYLKDRQRKAELIIQIARCLKRLKSAG